MVKERPGARGEALVLNYFGQMKYRFVLEQPVWLVQRSIAVVYLMNAIFAKASAVAVPLGMTWS